MLRFARVNRIVNIKAISMNRLIISAIGVILTFIWIVYTAPPRQNKLEKSRNTPIKKINKSASGTLNNIRQPIDKSSRSDSSGSNLYVITQISTDRNYEKE